MQGKHIFSKIVAAGFFVFCATAFVASSKAQAATSPQFLMTWQASNSYVPAAYPGKILPNQSSKITASVELLSQGQTLNVSRQIIYWYLNDILIGGGVGAQRITFTPFGIAPAAQTLRVELPNYPGSYLIHEINIPMVSPVAVIESPYPTGQFRDIPIALRALPYFFNASSSASLNFSWVVNGETVSSAENPQTLQISLPQSTPFGFNVATTLTIQNPANGMSAKTTANLNYQRQL